MPWSGVAPNQSFTRTDGTRTGDTTWAQAAAASVKIVTSGHDAHDTDIKDGINAALKKDGGNTATANIPMGGFTVTNIADATARTSPASFGQTQDNKPHYVSVVGGTGDATTLTPSPAITAYAAGQRFQYLAPGTNTGAATVNVSGLGAKSITNRDATFTAMSAGSIISGVMQDIEYDGTRFQYLAAPAVLIANDSITYAKIQNVTATSRVLGRKTAGAGDTEEITLSELLDFISSATKGDLLVRDTAAWARLAAGSSGQILTANGAGALPSYQAPASPTATQAELEAGASTTVYTSPGRQQFHPSASKAWVRFDSAGTVAASYNITSITDSGAGDWTVNIGTDFSSANYCGVALIGGSGTVSANIGTLPAAGTFRILTSGDPTPDLICANFFGDQA